MRPDPRPRREHAVHAHINMFTPASPPPVMTEADEIEARACLTAMSMGDAIWASPRSIFRRWLPGTRDGRGRFTEALPREHDAHGRLVAPGSEAAAAWWALRQVLDARYQHRADMAAVPEGGGYLDAVESLRHRPAAVAWQEDTAAQLARLVDQYLDLEAAHRDDVRSLAAKAPTKTHIDVRHRYGSAGPATVPVSPFVLRAAREHYRKAKSRPAEGEHYEAAVRIFELPRHVLEDVVDLARVLACILYCVPEEKRQALAAAGCQALTAAARVAMDAINAMDSTAAPTAERVWPVAEAEVARDASEATTWGRAVLYFYGIALRWVAEVCATAVVGSKSVRGSELLRPTCKRAVDDLRLAAAHEAEYATRCRLMYAAEPAFPHRLRSEIVQWITAAPSVLAVPDNVIADLLAGRLR